MRRPRAKLQVSTFPFLAVLLCAMGALLFLLFLMDRRAKIAAQYQVQQVRADRQKRTQAEEDARNAEWELARKKLHQSLAQEHHEVLGAAQAVQVNLEQAGKKLALMQTHRVDLVTQAQLEATRLDGLKAQLAVQQGSLKDTTKKETAARAELLEANKELVDLERAFQQLRALKEREKTTYSLVPYRGKHGDSRPPLYVECVKAGVQFHPEKKLLEGPDLSPASIRLEVERRAGALVREKSGAEKGKDRPYVLFLIRPDGIASYYQAASALNGFDLDFGYELVDQDWALDFSSPPPAHVARSGDTPRAGAGAPRAVEVSRPIPTQEKQGNGSAPNHGAVISPGGIAALPQFNGSSAGAGPAFIPKLAPPVAVASSNSGVSPINAPIPGNSAGTLRSTPGTPVTGASSSAPPVGQILGNKDFIITIDCHANHVSVTPGAMTFQWSAGSTQTTDQAFVQGITNLIARRQASVRPGEPLYRPMIRFQVTPQGLRTYYQAYPLLEHLRLPMTRENVEE